MDANMKAQRERLLAELRALGITNTDVLTAMERVPRHAFVPQDMQAEAYGNYPLPIGHNQTISQPFIVARMTQALLGDKRDKVLEIGTGSGYQTAILAELYDEVYTVERIEDLHQQATLRLKQLNYDNVHTQHSDGHSGWAQAAPFDAIMVTAVADETPHELLNQLAEGGCLICPVIEGSEQILKRYMREGDQFSSEHMEFVRFVPFKKGTE